MEIVSNHSSNPLDSKYRKGELRICRPSKFKILCDEYCQYVTDIARDQPFEFGFQSDFKYEISAGHYFFKIENTRRHYVTIKVGDNVDAFLDWYAKCVHRNLKFFYEFIMHGVPVKEYYDIDFTRAQGKFFKRSEYTPLSYYIIENFIEVRNKLVPDMQLEKKDMIILQSHRPEKISLRFYSQSTFFSSNDIQGVFVKWINSELQKHLEDKPIQFALDTSVYGSNRNMRIMYSSKFNWNEDNRVPLIDFGDEEFCRGTLRNTLIRNIPPNSRKMYIEDLVPIEFRKIQKNKISRTLNTDYTLDTSGTNNPILRKFLQENPQFDVIGKRLNRKCQESVPCFIDPTDTHSTENGYWFEKDGEVFVSCFTHNKPKSIGKQNMFMIEREKTVIDDITHDLGDASEIPELSSFGDDFKTLLIKAPFGMKKTVRAFEFLEQHPDKKVLIITHRVSLIKNMASRFNFKNYLDDDFSSDRLICCMNSLSKLGTDASRFDIVIIDEISAVLKQTDMKSDDIKNSVQYLLQFIQNMDRVLICMDGTLSNSDIEFIRKVRNDPDMKIIYSNKNVHKNVYFHQQKEDVEEMIIDDLRNNLKVAVAFSTSIESIKVFIEMNKTVFQNKKYLLISKANRSDEKLNPEYWLSYDIVFFSPTISEGYSFNIDYFNSMYAFGTTRTCTPEGFAQQLARIRPITDIHLHMNYARCTEPLYQDESDVEKYAKNNVSTIIKAPFIVMGVDKNFEPIIFKDPQWLLFCKNKIEKGKSFHTYEESLYQQLTDNGYTIYKVGDDKLGKDEVLAYRARKRESKKSVKERENTLILNSRTITKEQCKVYESKFERTEDEDRVISKYKITEALHIHTPTMKMFDYVKDIPRYRLLKNVVEPRRNFENDGNLEVVNTSDIIKMRAMGCLEALKPDVNSFKTQQDVLTDDKYARIVNLLKMTRILGYSDFMTNEGIPKDVFASKVNNLVNKISTYCKWKPIQSTFRQKATEDQFQKFLEAPAKWIFEKFKNQIGITFKLIDGSYYQVADFKMSLGIGDEIPPIFPCRIYDDDLLSGRVKEINEFINRRVDFCPTCNCSVRGGIWDGHIESKKHQKNIEKNGGVDLFTRDNFRPIVFHDRNVEYIEFESEIDDTYSRPRLLQPKKKQEKSDDKSVEFVNVESVNNNVNDDSPVEFVNNESVNNVNDNLNNNVNDINSNMSEPPKKRKPCPKRVKPVPPPSPEKTPFIVPTYTDEQEEYYRIYMENRFVDDDPYNRRGECTISMNYEPPKVKNMFEDMCNIPYESSDEEANSDGESDFDI
jgi:hypothetical protein